MTSAVATPARVRTRSRALAVHPDLLAGGAAALFALVLLVATWGTWGNLNQDTGYDAVAGARLADGELPYVDYLYYYGPLGPAARGAGGAHRRRRASARRSGSASPSRR